MLYVAIEKQPTEEIICADNQTTTTHAFLVNYFPDGSSFLPVFLSRLHAYIYLKPNRLFDNFRLVPMTSLELETYRNFAKLEKDTGKPAFTIGSHIVIGVSQQNKEACLVYFNKEYRLSDVFFEEEAIRKEMEKQMGAGYQLIIKNDTLSEDEIAKLGDKMIKEIGITAISLSDETSENTSDDIEKDTLKENMGSMYGFILMDKDGSIFTMLEGDVNYIPVFVNKLDAVIFSTMQREQMRDFPYEPISPNKNKSLVELLRLGYKKGDIRFRVALGFSGVVTPFGNKWAKHEDSSPSPSLRLMSCDFSDVEHGFDLGLYLSTTSGDKEIEQAMMGLMKTNLSSKDTLLNAAKKFIADMKENVVQADENNQHLYYRLIFIA